MDDTFTPVEVVFTATITTEQNSGWTCVAVPRSGELLGTRKASKVGAVVDGERIRVTLLPMGDGNHMLPLNAKLRKSLGKSLGDSVEVTIDQRYT